MREMKEKLVKNHCKGFDKRAKMFSYTCIGLLFISVCTFLPLTAALQFQNQTQEANAQEKKTDTDLKQERYIITIPE
jgi:hypothetical protein